MKYKLLALDVDGTLLNSKNEISKRTLRTLLKVQQMGVRIVLVSGRPTFGVLPLAKKLELRNYNGFIISYNGCKIINAGDESILYERSLSPEIIPSLERKAKKEHFSLMTYKGKTLITNDVDNAYIKEEAELNNLNLLYESDFSKCIDFSPYKCVLISSEHNKMEMLSQQWQKRLDGTVEVCLTKPYFMEIMPKGVDKATSMGLLLKLLNLTQEEVVSFGDGVCDVSMIQMAGLGVAMGQSPDSVKICADRTTLTNDEDGVAIAVEKIILSEIHPSDIPIEQLNKRSEHALMGNLGIQYTYASSTRVEATMPVDERTRQPFGILHGGATLALAETVAGIGSMLICKSDEIVVGMQVSGNHISSAHEGDTVRAVGTIVHKGRSSHVWNVDVFTSTDKLVSTVRVVNSVLKRQ